MIISRLAPFRIKYISDKVVHKIKTHILFSLTLSENRAVYKKMWKNIVESDSLQMTVWLTCIACCTHKATNTHSEYVKFCFSAATTVVLKRLNGTLYVLCLTCYMSGGFSKILNTLNSVCWIPIKFVEMVSSFSALVNIIIGIFLQYWKHYTMYEIHSPRLCK